MTSKLIQHQGQPRNRTLMAHGKGSTGHSSDVLDMREMAASLQKVLATASLIHTTRGDQGNEGVDTTQSLEFKQGGSCGIGGVG